MWQVAHVDYMQSSGSMIYLFPPQLFLPTGSTDLGQPGASSFTFEAFPAIGGTSLALSFQLHLQFI